MTAAPSGVTAIVTGAARNIGRQIAIALARDGASVLVTSRADRDAAEETGELVEAAGGRALVHLADLTDETQVAGMVEAAVSHLGPPTILVNNAALRKRQAMCDMTLAQWREVLAANLDAAFLCARACLPHMLTAGAGRIVNIGGKSAHNGAAERAHVVASKAALVGLTKAMAVEFGARGIAVNCVVPGDIDTERGAAAGPRGAHPAGRVNLVGRLGRPEEVAAIVAMLCGARGAYVTGQTIHVNGGGYLP